MNHCFLECFSFICTLIHSWHWSRGIIEMASFLPQMHQLQIAEKTSGRVSFKSGTSLKWVSLLNVAIECRQPWYVLRQDTVESFYLNMTWYTKGAKGYSYSCQIFPNVEGSVLHWWTLAVVFCADWFSFCKCFFKLCYNSWNLRSHNWQMPSDVH